MSIPTLKELCDSNEEYATFQAERTQAQEDVEREKREFRGKTYELKEIGLISDILLAKQFDIGNLEDAETMKIDDLMGVPGTVECRYEMLESYINKLDDRRIAVFADVPEHLVKLKDLETKLEMARAKTHAKWRAIVEEYEALEKAEKESKKS